ncbi:hypothetical protein QG37_06581 [Candidozyma auris]|nr:hypothetical protein QG37_06581 [[Candida] auris]
MAKMLRVDEERRIETETAPFIVFASRLHMFSRLKDASNPRSARGVPRAATSLVMSVL